MKEPHACAHCGETSKSCHYVPELTNPVCHGLYIPGESVHLCHTCCVETENLAPGYAWSYNLLNDRKPIMISETSKGVPYLDPAYETYHCM